MNSRRMWWFIATVFDDSCPFLRANRHSCSLSTKSLVLDVKHHIMACSCAEEHANSMRLRIDTSFWRFCMRAAVHIDCCGRRCFRFALFACVRCFIACFDFFFFFFCCTLCSRSAMAELKIQWIKIRGKTYDWRKIFSNKILVSLGCILMVARVSPLAFFFGFCFVRDERVRWFGFANDLFFVLWKLIDFEIAFVS